MKSDAIFSKDRAYRYVLTRIWSKKSEEYANMIAFIGLNPSKANENENDRTITKCINFAKSWGYDGIYMLNLFAYVSTSPDNLYNDSIDPIGNENDKFILEYSKKADKVVCVWGNCGSFKNRSKDVLAKLDKKYCLKINKSNEPSHPLYLAADTKLIEF
ncbi:DUF1643 domain-containing protein [Campylobacter corcagiensis]|uniref:DUF1643 domain-containing protein n=1 Tax=Campylobacter corcagiensis TaxID=1448857 RepID=A0A7M1LEC6_9BACT|nr:DUF1643 domain-containing protein [Campylobacter corcagiensis]QKF64914.1 DUF1643 domain-containing protein [Campylobacter corcagiensis]QOQ86927.1 DUF1643 domain-containing protein [Campylobacter corcagiensis]